MKNDDNLHSGHRERMLDKLLKSPESFSDYELIEVLLYSVIPRKNTNDVAHRLFNVFGSVEKIFDASAKELMSVDGIGKKVAAQIITFGQIVKRIDLKNTPEYKCDCFATIKKEFIEYFFGLNFEKLIVALFDSSKKFITKVVFSEGQHANVSVDMTEVAKAFAVNKPAFAIIAHNHPSGNIEPSKEDDFTTKKINVLCDMHGVVLLDHVIVSGNQAFSYNNSNKLEDIKRTAQLNAVLENIGE